MMAVIEGALDSELDALKARFEPAQTIALGGNWRAEICSLAGGELALLKTGVGTANAAAATALVCSRLAPCALISQGTAGAHDIDLSVGDVIIGRRIVRLGAYKSPSAGEGAGISPLAWRALSLEGSALGATEFASAPELTALALNRAKCRGIKHVRLGCVGSGDVWNCESDMIAFLNEHFGTDCEDMETYAAAQVCAEFGAGFLSLRAISNNELRGEAYKPASARLSQQLAGEVALSLIGAGAGRMR